jgi:hypothetical protein
MPAGYASPNPLYTPQFDPAIRAEIISVHRHDLPRLSLGEK